MNITLFETRVAANRLEPIALTRPVFDLRCGTFTFLERVRRLRPEAAVTLYVRPELADVTQERLPDCSVNPDTPSGGIWLDGGVFWRDDSLRLLEDQPGTAISRGGRMLGANLSAEESQAWLAAGGLLEEPPTVSEEKADVVVVDYLWDCVHENGDAIREDSRHFSLSEIKGQIDDGVHMINRGEISVGEGSRMRAGVILDAESGPVIIGENVAIEPGAYIEGPVFIGDGSLIKAGAKIFGETTIGPGCKVGGEVTESILQGWCNKQHDGFLGNAYIGEWVNLGAGTNNSDLKNNYTSVKVTVKGERIDTGSLFVGLFMGDHSKSAIGTLFNTGTVVGPACNVVTAGFPRRVIPPFSWVVNGKSKAYAINKFMETAIAAKERRGHLFSKAEEKLFRWIADQINR
ncbi:MAG: putative sugar nucleotidyl transferase [Candidatus Neomarinimicrobiota bacterium]|nr:putative sugar nucleotidyl transferase [Candidatus Neomarinimicrobiota bacterium]